MAPSCLKCLSFVLGAVLAGVAAAHEAAVAAAPAAPTLAAPLPTGLGSCHQPITLDAASSQVDYKSNTVDFRQVVISQCKTRVQADHAHATGLNFTNSRWTFDGNVHIEAEERGTLRSDEAVVEFRDNRITRATVTGKPAEFEQKRADSGQPARGHADEIVYDVTNGTVRLSNDAWLTNGQTEVSGSLLVYNIRGQSLQAGAQTGSGERVHIKIPTGAVQNPGKGEPAKPDGAAPPKPEAPQ
jgi:lipopolysaccharide transport protein LptA